MSVAPHHRPLLNFRSYIFSCIILLDILHFKQSQEEADLQLRGSLKLLDLNLVLIAVAADKSYSYYQE